MEIDQETVNFMQRRALVEEFRWNLKRLLREGFPDGLPLHTVEGQYKHWFVKMILPQMLHPNIFCWRDIFLGVPDLKQTFKVFKRDNIDYIRILKGPEDPSELEAVLRLVNFDSYNWSRLQPDRPDSTASPQSEPHSELNESLITNPPSALSIPQLTPPTAVSLELTGRNDEDASSTSTSSLSNSDAPLQQGEENLTQLAATVDVRRDSVANAPAQAEGASEDEINATTADRTPVLVPLPPGTDAQIQASVISSSSNPASSASLERVESQDDTVTVTPVNGCVLAGPLEQQDDLTLSPLSGLEANSVIVTPIVISNNSTNTQAPPDPSAPGTEDDDEDGEEDEVVFLSESPRTAKDRSRLRSRKTRTNGEQCSRPDASAAATASASRTTVVPLATLSPGLTTNELVTMTYVGPEPPQRRIVQPANLTRGTSYRRRTPRGPRGSVWGGRGGRMNVSSAAMSYLRNVLNQSIVRSDLPPREFLTPTSERRGKQSGRNGRHTKRSTQSRNPVERPASTSTSVHARTHESQVARNREVSVSAATPAPMNSETTTEVRAPVETVVSRLLSSATATPIPATADPLEPSRKSSSTVVSQQTSAIIRPENDRSVSPVDSRGSDRRLTNDTPNTPTSIQESSSTNSVRQLESRDTTAVPTVPLSVSTHVVQMTQREASSTPSTIGDAERVNHVEDDQVAGPSRGIPSTPARKRQSEYVQESSSTPVDKKARGMDSPQTNNFNTLVRSIMDALRYSVHGGKQEEDLKRVEYVTDNSDDWMALPVQSDMNLDNALSRGFYRSNSVPCGKVQLYRSSSWRSYTHEPIGSKTLYLPPNTVVYGEFLDQFSSRKWKYPLTVFHIIDAPIVDGVDVSRKSFSERRQACMDLVTQFMEGIEKRDYIFVKLKPAVKLRSMKSEIFDILEPVGNKVCIPDEMYPHRKPLVQVNGILFVRITKNRSVSNFTVSMNDRRYWKWSTQMCLCAENLLGDEVQSELALWMFLEQFFIRGIEIDTSSADSDDASR